MRLLLLGHQPRIIYREFFYQPHTTKEADELLFVFAEVTFC